MNYDYLVLCSFIALIPNDKMDLHFFHLLYDNEKVNSDYYDIVLKLFLKKQKYDKLIKSNVIFTH